MFLYAMYVNAPNHTKQELPVTMREPSAGFFFAVSDSNELDHTVLFHL